ncbi:MAG: Ku protein [Kofleriaceae bacterium]
MPARAIGTATISFGLVAIPVKVYTSSEPSHEIHFHLIHEDCGERVKQQYVCPKHGQVDRDEMTKGYEIKRGNFVELSKEELEKLEAVASNEVEIREFVPAAAVDPIYVDRTYYLGPGKGGERAYRLLRDALEDAELVGIASYAARGKQYVVMVRAYETGLAMHQLRYGDEIKPWTEVPIDKLPKPPASELALAAKVIAHLRHDSFDPSAYEDEVKGRVRELIAEKAKGGEIVVAPEAPRPAVTDLMAALKASLEGKPEPGQRESAKHEGKRATNGHRRATRRSQSHRAHATRGRRHGTRARAA